MQHDVTLSCRCDSYCASFRVALFTYMVFNLLASIFLYIETRISIMFEQTNVNNSASMDDYDHYRQLIIKSILSILSLGFAYYYLWSIRRPNSHINHTTTNATSACNNPTCLRCHSNSQQHAASFQNNVMMLRRLVQLEPDLFNDMRSEIWDEIHVIEERFANDCSNIAINLLVLKRKFLEVLKKIRHIPSNTAVATEKHKCLSPQPGQNPTVFFLRGLEAIPLHTIETCTTTNGRQQQQHDCCPCIRLWEEMPRQPNEPPVTLTGDIDALQTHYAAIREELMSVMTQEKALFQPFDSAVYKHATTSQQQQQQNQQQQAEWSSIYLYRQGIKQVETCNTYFPITTNILETMCPHHMGGKCGFGSIYLSKLKQNTKVVEHCGPTNVRLRCHLPLVVPKNTSGSYLKVGEHCVTWEEGIPILFDDSFVHSAVHVGSNDRSGSSSDSSSTSSNEQYDGDRIVLIVDLWHPALSESDRTALGVLYPPGS